MTEPQTLRQAALAASQAAQQREDSARRHRMTEAAQEAAKMVKSKLGFDATPNPDDGTAVVDELRFKVLEDSDYDPFLAMSVYCKTCGGEFFIKVRHLAEVGKHIEANLIVESYEHHCPGNGL